MTLPPTVRRWLAPSLSDFLFVAMLGWLFVASPNGWARLLFDGDTGWHIRTGEYILAHGAVPRVDIFSFSKPGAEWFAWEWGADIIYALLHRGWGLRGVVWFSGVQVVLFSWVLFRYMLWSRVNALVCLGMTLVAMVAASVHYLARPHLFTLVLLPAALWLVAADRRSPTRWVWALVPLTAVWTNLHGGVLALIACLGLLTVGVAAEARWSGGAWFGSAFYRYATLTAACGAATVLNPYGARLHFHLVAYLRSDWIREAVQEFQSPSFRAENLLQYEVLLLGGLMVAAVWLARGRVVEPLWILFWAHQSLGSVRHVTVFVTIAAPIAALCLSELWEAWSAGASRKSLKGIFRGLGVDLAPAFGRQSVWPLAVVVVLAVPQVNARWPGDFPSELFPVATIARHEALLRDGRLLTSDEWADYLLYRFYPRQKVFIDGRSDFYGPDIGKQYVRLSGAQRDWKSILEKHRFSVALVPAGWGLASVLRQDPAWHVVEEDAKSILLARTSAFALMLPPGSAEHSRGVLNAMGKAPEGQQQR